MKVYLLFKREVFENIPFYEFIAVYLDEDKAKEACSELNAANNDPLVGDSYGFTNGRDYKVIERETK